MSQNTRLYRHRRMLLSLLVTLFCLLSFRIIVELLDSEMVGIESNGKDEIHTRPVTKANASAEQGRENVKFDHLLGSKRPEVKFRVRTENLKKTYKVSEKIRIVIEPRHPKLLGKLTSSFFRVQVIGVRTFSPEQIKSSNSSQLVFEAPLVDPGLYKVRVRIMFYNYREMYSLESTVRPDPKISPKVKLLDRIIIDGDWNFTVVNSKYSLSSDVPSSCSDIDTLTGRWTSCLKEFLPYECNIPKYERTAFPRIFEKNSFRYGWIRFIGDSNTRGLFQTLQRHVGHMECVWVHESPKAERRTQYVCVLPYSNALYDDDLRPKELVLTYEWFFPGSYYNLESLLNSTFEDICKPFTKCRSKELCNFQEPLSYRKFCANKHADYTFISIGSHTPEWNERTNDIYLREMFDHIHQNYNHKITFMTTNAANVHNIPRFYGIQYIIRNNFRIARANEMLRKHVEISVKQGYKNIDLLDIFSTSQPIWEYSRDAVHYNSSIYNVHARLVLDKLIAWLEKQV
ncbi:16595_t:CDS:2 [Acaulospora morrowiae]|uniref:16595_t:CDS:1 n=1 Tax=Acaulospora morrowiae TaxID=94023 RepID=A0A9N8VFB7_9GLOM|nr:16595_t:CDS:2 [Acaulospora morrowiae]